MRVGTMVRRICSECSGDIHAGRLAALEATVEALTASKRLSVSGIGGGLRNRAMLKHSIKRVDRLLSNPHLQSERWDIFRSVAHHLVGDVARPVILMDWTAVVDKFSALVAAVPVGGRALTIYEEVHPERSNNKPRVQARFLRRLGEVIPAGSRPIIIVDAGFKAPFFRAVQRMGWDFIGRERQHVGIKLRGSDAWIFTKQAFAKARRTAKDLGTGILNKSQGKSFATRFVVITSPRHPNHPWKKRFRGNLGSKDREAYKRGAHQPWLLPTSLTHLPAEQIVALYAKRMQIEQIFRDLKNPRFGWSLRHARGYSAARLTILLLVATLATFVVTLVGLAVEQKGRHRAYQANTARTRVLSLFVLGGKILARNDPFILDDALRGIPFLRATLASYVEVLAS
jgi:Transposase DDE domain